MQYPTTVGIAALQIITYNYQEHGEKRAKKKRTKAGIGFLVPAAC